MEKFLAARRARRQAQLDMLNTSSAKPAEPKPIPSPQPKPTGTKPAEKKKDPWDCIRGMSRADAIIADLKAGGIMSYSDLSSFFQGDQADDHTTELVELKKKFTAIDTLIIKMKHRYELIPVYKEYQSKSGWSQSRFRKKNAAAIEDYEQTAKYIKIISGNTLLTANRRQCLTLWRSRTS